MTEQQPTPEPVTIDIAPDTDAFNRAAALAVEAWKDVAQALGDAWQQIKPAVLNAARLAETQTAAEQALGACFAEEDAAARQALADLDAEQLRDVENAAVALSLTACRIRTKRESINP